jgi:hypothetical protein
MKLFKSLLLASATGLVAVSGASAADLGAKKPSPVEYVRACYNPLWGTSGGFVIPGTQTCLRVFGQARFDMHYAQPFARANSLMGYRGGMTVGLDAITPSEYGNVRAFASIGAVYRSGNQNSGTNVRNGFAIGGTFPAGQNSPGQTEINYTGFIQFAGFTMGRTASFFRTVGQPSGEIIGSTFMSGPGNVNTIAYTANLGSGFLATVALEDPTTRRFGVASQTLFFAGTPLGLSPNLLAAGGFGATPSVFTGAALVASPGILGSATISSGFAAGGLVLPIAAGNFLQIGNRMPNVVASLRLDQAWGSAELAGMINEVGVNGNIPQINTVTGVAIPGVSISPSSKIGWAVNGALKINLPMLAAGSNFTLNGAYSQGNLSAVLSNWSGNSAQAFNIGGVAVVAADATISQFGGGLRLTEAWSVTAGLQHFWTPTVSSTLFGSYAQVDVKNNVGTIVDPLRDFTLWSVGLNTIWQPVRGLNIGLEGVYTQMNVQGRMYDVNKNVINGQLANALSATACNVVTLVGCRTKASDGQFQARLRVTRDF